MNGCGTLLLNLYLQKRVAGPWTQFPNPCSRASNWLLNNSFYQDSPTSFRPLHINCISVLLKSLTTPRREHGRYSLVLQVKKLKFKWIKWAAKELLVELKLTTRFSFFSPFLTLTLWPVLQGHNQNIRTLFGLLCCLELLRADSPHSQ